MSHKNKGLEEHLEGRHPRRPDRQLHRDWRIWVAVLLMLAAMTAYLLTLGERIVPGDATAGKPASTNAPIQP